MCMYDVFNFSINLKPYLSQNNLFCSAHPLPYPNKKQLARPFPFFRTSASCQAFTGSTGTFTGSGSYFPEVSASFTEASGGPSEGFHCYPTRMSRTGSERIKGDRINRLFQFLINGAYWGYNPLILTFDPNFLDIQVVLG